MYNKLLSQITPEQLIQDFKELELVSKIAVKYKISISTVYTAFKIINYDCFVNTKVSDLVSKEILEEAYARLGTIKAVGRELKIAPDSVKDYMLKFGLTYKPQVKYNCDHNFFSKDNEESFYVAGFIAADGCVKKHNSGNSFQLQIGLSIKDKEHLKLIKEKLNSESPIHDYLVKNSKRNPKWNDTWKSEITITSKQMFDDLSRFNIVPRKSLIYTFPKWMKTHSLKHHFIRGYNDGDGSFYLPKLAEDRTVEQVYFSLRGTPECLIDIRSILEEECNLEQRNTEIRISNKHGVLEYGGNGIINKIVDYLYQDATIYLPRKKEIAIMAKNYK